MANRPAVDTQKQLHPAGISTDSDKCDNIKRFWHCYFIMDVYEDIFLASKFMSSVSPNTAKDEPDIYGFLSHWHTIQKMHSHVGDNVRNW